MKIVHITYTVPAAFSVQNQDNIRTVMNDLQKADYSGIRYMAFLSADHKTFMHTAFFRSDEDQKLLHELPSFRLFQEELKSSGPEVPPKQEVLTLVGSSNKLF